MKAYKIDFTRHTVIITKEFAVKAAVYNSNEYKMLMDVGDLVHSPDSFRFTDTMFAEHPEVVGRTDNAHAKAVASSVFERQCHF